MTNSSVSFQGFTQQNDTCDTSKLSQRGGSPQLFICPSRNNGWFCSAARAGCPAYCRVWLDAGCPYFDQMPPKTMRPISLYFSDDF